MPPPSHPSRGFGGNLPFGYRRIPPHLKILQVTFLFGLIIIQGQLLTLNFEGATFVKNKTLYANGLRPPLKWAGGKRWLVPILLPIWRRYKNLRLVEPLCGGLAVTLGLVPEKALLNDVNPHLINFFKWIQKGLTIEIPLENNESFYYAHRERFNQLVKEGKEDTKEAAKTCV